MTEEEKAKIAEAEKANAEFEVSLEGLSEEEKTEKRTEREATKKGELLKPDYETQLALEKERREKAEKLLADKDFKLRELKRKEKEELDEDGNPIVPKEEPLTESRLEEILSKDRQKTRKELQSEVIVEKARKLATSETEANLIIEIHANRTFPEGMSLDEQLEESCAIANSKPFMTARKAELARANKSKETISKDALGTYHEPPAIGEPQISAAEKKALTGSGFVWDGKQGLYIKTLKDKLLTFNPRTKKRQVITK